jgi:hypothetical protein
VSDEPDPVDPVDPVDPIEEMNTLHVELGRKAAAKALEVLESVNVSDIPVATAVSLLKFGVELERKALLGVEPDGDGSGDPFDALAKALGGQPPTPEQEKPEQEKGA